MTRYRYTFESKTEFSAPVSVHSFMLRVTPLDDALQQLLSHSLTVTPFPDCISRGTDAWGAALDYGIIREMHREFYYKSEGLVEVTEGVRIDAAPSPLFLLHTKLTGFNPVMASLCADEKGLEAAGFIAASVNRAMTYVPGSTDVDTSAECAFFQRKGVCQDYAHLMVSVCRECGIPARYVCGFVRGEGETHAWTEVWVDGAWYGFDATSGQRCDDRYIALAFGRDASDCSVNRGLFMGASLQHAETRVKVEFD